MVFSYIVKWMQQRSVSQKCHRQYRLTEQFCGRCCVYRVCAPMFNEKLSNFSRGGLICLWSFPTPPYLAGYFDEDYPLWFDRFQRMFHALDRLVWSSVSSWQNSSSNRSFFCQFSFWTSELAADRREMLTFKNTAIAGIMQPIFYLLVIE